MRFLRSNILPLAGAALARPAAAQEASAAADSTESTEARTLRAGTTRPRPGETLGQLLHRMLPASGPDTAAHLVRYAWFASPAGPQQFCNVHGLGDQGQYAAALSILNPLGAGAYDVQCLDLDSMGDVTDVAAIFFADASHDGQKDLLALTQCDLREYAKADGQTMSARSAHYLTTVIYYRGLDSAGRPRYEQQCRADLAELATAAVRQWLAAPPRPNKSTSKRNPAAKAAE